MCATLSPFFGHRWGGLVTAWGVTKHRADTPGDEAAPTAPAPRQPSAVFGHHTGGLVRPCFARKHRAVTGTFSSEKHLLVMRVIGVTPF